jgi:hypothetical protein
MRSMKSSIYRYARRQARRDVYRAVKSYNRNTTKTEHKEVDVGESLFGLFIFVIGIFLFFGWLAGV